MSVLPLIEKLRLLPANAFSRCLICDLPSRGLASVCTNCRAELPWLDRPCDRCGESLESMPALITRCNKCLLKSHTVDRCQGLFHYQSPIDKMIAGFKFKARFDFGSFLSRLLTESTKLAWQLRAPPELIVPVPLHRCRQRERGFNQAIVLARAVAEGNGIPLKRHHLRKLRDTPAQTSMSSAHARRANPVKAFALDTGNSEPVRSVALIDDVVTTMATVTAVTKVLKQSGVKHVEVWCLARTTR